ncbi:hypothetical protein ACS3SW_13735 [Roseobacteraceae bacterium S113]
MIALLRFAALLSAFAGALWLSHWVRGAVDLDKLAEGGPIMWGMIYSALAIYVVLLAIPFVPGAEIGLTLLTVFGVAMAPWVYGATVLGLVLAFVVGRYVPGAWVLSGLRLLRLTRAAQAFEETRALPRKARLEHILAGGSPGIVRFAARHRYLALVAALNLPGNVLIGGGGGIAMAAGMSGLFGAVPFVVTTLVAVAPLPLFVLLVGL